MRAVSVLNVAVTGNAAAGKSAVVQWFKELGATVIDADAIVREVQAPGSPVLEAIARRFGSRFIRPDGTLDRAALRGRVMGDDDALASLNAMVHPAVQRRRLELAAAASARGDRVVVNEIPLLFEVMDPAEFDLVVLVDAPPETRRTRLTKDRGLPGGDADRLLASQLPAASKRQRSDLVIENDGTLEDLERRARNAWEFIIQRAGEERKPSA